jgi:hypothetical protein
MLISVADWHWNRHEFEDMFFGGWAYSNSGLTRHVAFGDLIVVMIALMAVLTYIARDADSDGQPTSRNVKTKCPVGIESRSSWPQRFCRRKRTSRVAIRRIGGFAISLRNFRSAIPMSQ